MADINGAQIRQKLLGMLDPNNTMETAGIFAAVEKEFGMVGRDPELKRAILTLFHDLICSGQVAWGADSGGSKPALCFVTDRGRETLKHLDRDPMNRDGYLEYLRKQMGLGPIAKAYVEEALKTYAANCYKATAVMIGTAAERMALDLRDAIVSRLQALGRSPRKQLQTWVIRTVLDEIQATISQALESAIKAGKTTELVHLSELFAYNWPAMSHMIRAMRNDAGHPVSIEPVTQEDVHAALLTFPHHARIANDVINWLATAQL
ncbi:MAG: hypothetical protein ACJ8FY_10500 [Gemmataceae bacterium]